MLLIRNARLLTMAPGTSGEMHGDMLVHDGEISATGEVRIPSGCEVIDVDGAYVAPGFIDCHCHVGLAREGEDWEYSDVNETTSPVTWHVRAIDGVDWDDPGFSDAVRGGVTTLLIHPGSTNVVGGTSVAVKPAGRQRVYRDPAAVKMAWPHAATVGSHSPFQSSDTPYPTTRMGITSILREVLAGARAHERDELDSGSATGGARGETLRLLVRVLRGELPVCIHSMTPADFLAIMRLQDEFGFELSLHHAHEAHLVAPELARRGIGVIYGPSLDDRRIDIWRRSDPRAVIRLLDAKVPVGLQTDHPVWPIRDFRYLGGLMVRYGLDSYRALRTLTTYPAAILGAPELGSLEEGKRADFSVFSGHPLSNLSRVERVYIAGERVL